MTVEVPYRQGLKFCISCTFCFGKAANDEQANCLSNSNPVMSVNLVTGIEFRRYRTCKDARGNENGCGVAGHWFVNRNADIPVDQRVSVQKKSLGKIDLKDL